MTLRAIPVRIERGVVRTVDGSPLPDQANGLLVIMPSEPEGEGMAEWQRPFDAYFEHVRRNQPSKKLEQIGEAELNELVHTARRK